MPFEIQAIYEDGVLKPETPLPLDEHQRVTVVVHPATGIRAVYGIIGWKGDPEVARILAEDPDYGINGIDEAP